MNNIIKTVGLVSVGALIALSTSNIVMAQDGYCTGAVVKEVGAKVEGTTPKNVVLLQNSQATGACGNWAAGGLLWFYLDSPNQDGMLASALTALSLGQPVTVVSKAGNTYTNWGSLIHVTVSAQ